MKEDSNGEPPFLNTLLKRNNGKIPAPVYRKSTHTEQFLHYSFHHQSSCKKSAVPSLFKRAYSMITNEDDLTKEVKQYKKVSVERE